MACVGRERRFADADVEAAKVTPGGERIRREDRYVRVSGIRGQESSLAAQEAELRAAPAAEVARVFADRASAASCTPAPRPAGASPAPKPRWPGLTAVVKTLVG